VVKGWHARPGKETVSSTLRLTANSITLRNGACLVPAPRPVDKHPTNLGTTTQSDPTAGTADRIHHLPQAGGPHHRHPQSHWQFWALRLLRFVVCVRELLSHLRAVLPAAHPSSCVLHLLSSKGSPRKGGSSPQPVRDGRRWPRRCRWPTAAERRTRRDGGTRTTAAPAASRRARPRRRTARRRA
jgi:hypothetical protein